jgi:hypothetical protein
MLYVVIEMNVLNTHCIHKFMNLITQQAFCGNRIIQVETHVDLAWKPHLLLDETV